MAQHKHFPQGWSTNRLHAFSMCGFSRVFLCFLFCFVFCLWAAEPVFIKTKKRRLPVWIRVLYSNCRTPYLMVYLLIELIRIFSKGEPTRKAESKRTENIFTKQKQRKLSQITQCQSRYDVRICTPPSPFPSTLICDTSLPCEVSTSFEAGLWEQSCSKLMSEEDKRQAAWAPDVVAGSALSVYLVQELAGKQGCSFGPQLWYPYVESWRVK